MDNLKCETRRLRLRWFISLVIGLIVLYAKDAQAESLSEAVELVNQTVFELNQSNAAVFEAEPELQKANLSAQADFAKVIETAASTSAVKWPIEQISASQFGINFEEFEAYAESNAISEKEIYEEIISQALPKLESEEQNVQKYKDLEVNNAIVDTNVPEKVVKVPPVQVQKNVATRMPLVKTIEATPIKEQPVSVPTEEVETQTEVFVQFPQYAGEEYLLAQMIELEAGESFEDKTYVGSVVLNRARTSYYGFSTVNSIREVLNQPGQYASRTKKEISKGRKPSAESQKIAHQLITGEIPCQPEYVLFQTASKQGWMRGKLKDASLPGAEQYYGIPADYPGFESNLPLSQIIET